MRISVAIIPALALALTVSACSSTSNGKGSAIGASGSSGSSGSTSATTGASATTPTTSAAVAAPDEAKLKTLVLTAADVPSSWTASPSSSSGDNSPDDAASQAQLAACLGVPNSDKKQVASADSDDYDLANSSISSNASSYSSQDVVDQDAAALSKSNAASCFKQGLQKALTSQLPAGATVDKFDITITPGAGGGPSNVAGTLRVEVLVGVAGQQAHVYLDIVLIKGKLIEASVQFTGFGAPIAADIEAKAVRAVADRVAAA